MIVVFPVPKRLSKVSGLLVPIPTEPVEVIRTFSISAPPLAVLKTMPVLVVPAPPPVNTALPPIIPIAAYSLDSSSPVIPNILEVSLPL